MDFRTSYRVKEIGVILGVILLFFAMTTESNLMVVLGILVAVVSLVQAFIFYRCPYCKGRFPIREKPSSFCPECGHPLQTAKEEKAHE